jgi:hypothetical protein
MADNGEARTPGGQADASGGPRGGEANGQGVPGAAVVVAAAAAAPPHPSRTVAPRQARFGEELPIFCERCGYSLNGLPQLRCDACAVLHFSCPECDHHQPINTLRPAVQRALGRLRSMGLAVIVFLKLNYFGWGLFAWGTGGYAIAYSYSPQPGLGNAYGYGPTEFETIGGIILFLFGLGFAMFGRMFLLRWRHGVLVGLGIAGLIVLALLVGAHLRQWEYMQYRGDERRLPSPVEAGFVQYLFWAAVGATAGASCAWGIWLSLAHAFLPKRAAVALIEWQRAMSDPVANPRRTDATTSVTV